MHIIFAGELPSGDQHLGWAGTGGGGQRMASGLYLLELEIETAKTGHKLRLD